MKAQLEWVEYKNSIAQSYNQLYFMLFTSCGHGYGGIASSGSTLILFSTTICIFSTTVSFVAQPWIHMHFYREPFGKILALPFWDWGHNCLNAQKSHSHPHAAMHFQSICISFLFSTIQPEYWSSSSIVPMEIPRLVNNCFLRQEVFLFSLSFFVKAWLSLIRTCTSLSKRVTLLAHFN